MYCVNGESGSSLLIESTDSTIENDPIHGVTNSYVFLSIIRVPKNKIAHTQDFAFNYKQYISITKFA